MALYGKLDVGARDFYPIGLDPFLVSTGLYFASWLTVIVSALVYRRTLRRFVRACARLTAVLLIVAAALRAFGDLAALRDTSTLVIEVVLLGSALALWGLGRRMVPSARDAARAKAVLQRTATRSD